MDKGAIPVKEIELLEAAKAKCGSDLKVAKHIDVSDSLIPDIRGGRRHLTDYQAAQLAELCGFPPLKTVMALKAARARTDEEERYWLGKWRGLAAAVLVALAGLSAPSSLRASAEPDVGPNIQCAQFRPVRCRPSLTDETKVQYYLLHFARWLAQVLGGALNSYALRWA